MNEFFEVISEAEYKAGVQEVVKEKKKRGRKLVTEPRNNTTWFTLPTEAGYCTIPLHDEIQRVLNPEQQEYRQKYPTRHVYEISENLFICRDCYIYRADEA